jgi:hypothetical protein
MHNLSMAQALSIWTAYHGKNAFGGDTAEIYIYKLMPYEPLVASVVGVLHESPTAREASAWAYDRANTSLHALLTHFSKTRDARVEVDGHELGEWLKGARFDHRVRVRVVPR